MTSHLLIDEETEVPRKKTAQSPTRTPDHNGERQRAIGRQSLRPPGCRGGHAIRFSFLPNSLFEQMRNYRTLCQFAMSKTKLNFMTGKGDKSELYSLRGHLSEMLIHVPTAVYYGRQVDVWAAGVHVLFTY